MSPELRKVVDQLLCFCTAWRHLGFNWDEYTVLLFDDEVALQLKAQGREFNVIAGDRPKGLSAEAFTSAYDAAVTAWDKSMEDGPAGFAYKTFKIWIEKGHSWNLIMKMLDKGFDFQKARNRAVWKPKEPAKA